MSSYHCIAGVDESGKGDFFGSLVIAGLAAKKSDESELHSLGVRDSKLIADKKLIGIDGKLRERFPHIILIVAPSEYNQRYERIKNLNKLLAQLHAEAIVGLIDSSEADLAVSDKFGKAELIESELAKKGCGVELKQLVRGERIPQVAAASILARAAFLREMVRLSAEIDFDLPRGAGPPVDKAGRLIVSKLGAEILPTISKLHFKNYQRVVNPQLFA